MERQKQLIAHKIIRFNQISFIKAIEKGRKTGTFRTNHRNKYAPGDSVQLFLEEVEKDWIKNVHFGEICIKSVVKVDIVTSLDSLKIDNGAIISVIHEESVLNAIAQSDGFTCWEQMKSYFGQDFSGSWIQFEMATLKILPSWTGKYHRS